MTFQKTTIKVAVVVYIICTIALAIMLYQGSSSVLWPPETGTCPDLWLTQTPRDSSSNDQQLSAEGGINVKIKPSNHEGFSLFSTTSGGSKCVPNTSLTKENGNWGDWPCIKNTDGRNWVCPTMNFDERPYNSPNTETSIAAKCYWANKNNIYWSGVTDVGSACNISGTATSSSS